MHPIPLAFGLALVVYALYAFRSPRLGGLRDARLIRTDEPDEAERWTAYAIGVVFLAVGLFFVYYSV